MKNLRWLIPAVALAAVLGNGCIITSAQVLAHFDLTSPVQIRPPATPMFVEVVDLNTVSDYSKNKDKLKGLSDIAVVGTFTNNAPSPAGSIEIWIMPGISSLTSSSSPALAKAAGAVQLWGPDGLDVGTSTKTVNWNDSAKLFNPAGKQVLIDAMKGAGVFTVFIFPTGAAGNSIDIVNGSIILVIAAGL